MALNKLKKWIGTQAMTAFFDQLNYNVDATNAAIDLAEQTAANISPTNFILPAQSSVTLKHGAAEFAYMLVLQGKASNLYGTYILQGYSIGGSRYHVATLHEGSTISVTIPPEGDQSFVVSNTSSSSCTAGILKLLGSPPAVV